MIDFRDWDRTHNCQLNPDGSIPVEPLMDWFVLNEAAKVRKYMKELRERESSDED